MSTPTAPSRSTPRCSCRCGRRTGGKRQLAARQRSLVNSDDQADAVQVERYESLFKVAYAEAMAGDMRAQEQRRRLLLELVRLRGIEAAGALSFPAPPVDDVDDDDEDGLDDLEAYRQRRAAKYESRSIARGKPERWGRWLRARHQELTVAR